MLLASPPIQNASLSAMLHTLPLFEGLLNLGNWAGSSQDLRCGVHCQTLDVDPRDPNWLSQLCDSLGA
jgi:hypothetical protein